MNILCWSFFFTVFLVNSCTQGVKWDGLVSTFSELDFFRLNSFFSLPRDLTAAYSKRWVSPEETKSEKYLTTLCERNDGRVCLLYDGKGSIAGYQLGVPKAVDTIIMEGIKIEEKGFTTAKMFGEDWYIARVYFESQEVIRNGGRDWDEQTGTGLWLPIGGNLTEIPMDEKDMAEKIPEFKKQNCYNKMGRHYFFNISKDMKPEHSQPFFVFYSNKGELVGWGLNGFGANAENLISKEPLPFVFKRTWFEFVPTFKVRDVAPDTPDWALNYMNKYGLYSHHVYLVSKPWLIRC